MHNLANIALNFFLITIPEQLFLILMTLILTKKFGLLDVRMWRENLKWIMIPLIPISILISINEEIVNNSIMTIANLIVFYIIITFVIKQNSDNFQFKDYKKIFFKFIISFFILGTLECITAPIMLFLLHKPLIFVQNNSFWYFIASAPSRIIEFLIIIILIVKNNNVVKFRLLDIISQSNFLYYSITIFVILSNVFAVYGIKLVGLDGILEEKVPMLIQIIISMSILVFPAIMLSWVLLIINQNTVRERSMQQACENLVNQDDISF